MFETPFFYKRNTAFYIVNRRFTSDEPKGNFY